jgi:hypothetical protein
MVEAAMIDCARNYTDAAFFQEALTGVRRVRIPPLTVADQRQIGAAIPHAGRGVAYDHTFIENQQRLDAQRGWVRY